MYPDFHYLLKSLLGIDIPALSFIKTFGFFVALAFIAGAYFLTKELKRKSDAGLFPYTIRKYTKGEKVQTKDWLPSGILGFIIGYKLIGLIIESSAQTAGFDPMNYLFTIKGHFIGGIALAVVMAWMRYREKKKEELPTPKTIEEKVYPHHRVMDIVFISAIAGFAGAKIFNAFESWEQFIQNPIDSLISSGGFTFYGGLIVATIALYLYGKKKNMSFRHLCDAAAPALMIAYAIGRLGCHFSGDGDWGVYNSAYITQADGTLTEQIDETAFIELTKNQEELFTEFSRFESVPHIYAPAPNGIPRWLYGMNYHHNVNREGIQISGDSGFYNTALPAAVFPTSIYEFVVCMILFGILMMVRRKMIRPLSIFGFYLILNGFERFFIEKIRVNYKYDWGFWQPSQAEIISLCMIIVGVALFINSNRRKNNLIVEK